MRIAFAKTAIFMRSYNGGLGHMLMPGATAHTPSDKDSALRNLRGSRSKANDLEFVVQCSMPVAAANATTTAEDVATIEGAGDPDRFALRDHTCSPITAP